MTSNNTEVDLDVSGPTARGVAASILSIVDEAGDDIDTASVEVTAGDTVVSIDGDGPRADEIVPQMVASIDWEDVGLDGLSVSLESAAGVDESFEPPADPDEGDRITEWERADVPPSMPARGSQRRDTLRVLAGVDSATTNELAEETDVLRDTLSGDLSVLYNEYGVVDRARIFASTGGRVYTYRVNEHGRLFLDE